MASNKRQTNKRQKRAAAEPVSSVQHSNSDCQESEENDQPSKDEPEPKIVRKPA